MSGEWRAPGGNSADPEAINPGNGMSMDRTMLPTPALTWSLRIHRAVVGEVHVFAPAGRLGTLSSGDLIEALVTAIKEGARLVVVDLAAVDYISSAGLLALDAVSGRVQAVGGALVLCGLVEPVRLAFDLAGLLPHFAIEPSRDLAFARLATGNTSPSGNTSRSQSH